MAKLGKRGVNPGGILSTQEVATVLGISHPTLLKLLKSKQIPEPQICAMPVSLSNNCAIRASFGPEGRKNEENRHRQYEGWRR
jgi:hypothetical protein